VTEASEATEIGRYRLCYEVASGGMATVYLARDDTDPSERVLAVKRIHPHLSKRRDFVEMFLDEARLSSRLDHPNICRVVDFGEARGAYYIAMEYLVGEPLTNVFRAMARQPERLASPLWPRIVARIIADVCAGLHAAHELRDDDGKLLDVIHRDITPSNLHVTYGGRAVVMDFGIARSRDRLHETATDTIKGKNAYMAPEYVNGERIDRRADIFAVGVVLWELLTGQRLFRRENQAQTLMMVTTGPIPNPSSIVGSVPPALESITLKALARKVDDRHRTAADLGDALRGYLAGAGDVREADVAAWLAELFPARLEERSDIVRRAAGRPPPPPPPDPTAALPVAPAERFLAEASTTQQRWVHSARVSRRRALIAIGSAASAAAAFAFLMRPEEPAPRAGTISIPSVDPDPPPVPEPPPPVPPPLAPPAPPPPGPAEAPPPRAAKVKPKPGRVDLVTVGGWGEVYEGTRHLGTTPLRIELEAGRHVLEVRPFGKLPGRRVPVVVKSRGVTRVSVPIR
jgi:serine/threonine-protein kinase